MKPKVSVIVPFMEADEGKVAILNRLLDSLVGADEIIIAENWKEGYAVPINCGLERATGDYLIIMNDDLIQTMGDLHDLCVPGVVTSPTVDADVREFWGCCFCIPREVYKKVGGLDERYRVSYFDDDDYINILRSNDIPMRCIPSVDFENVDGGGRTLHTFADHEVFFEENRQRFIDKWGGTPESMTIFWQIYGRLPEKEEVI